MKGFKEIFRLIQGDEGTFNISENDMFNKLFIKLPKEIDNVLEELPKIAVKTSMLASLAQQKDGDDQEDKIVKKTAKLIEMTTCAIHEKLLLQYTFFSLVKMALGLMLSLMVTTDAEKKRFKDLLNTYKQLGKQHGGGDNISRIIQNFLIVITLLTFCYNMYNEGIYNDYNNWKTRTNKHIVFLNSSIHNFRERTDKLLQNMTNDFQSLCSQSNFILSSEKVRDGVFRELFNMISKDKQLDETTREVFNKTNNFNPELICRNFNLKINWKNSTLQYMRSSNLTEIDNLYKELIKIPGIREIRVKKFDAHINFVVVTNIIMILQDLELIEKTSNNVTNNSIYLGYGDQNVTISNILIEDIYNLSKFFYKINKTLDDPFWKDKKYNELIKDYTGEVLEKYVENIHKLNKLQVQKDLSLVNAIGKYVGESLEHSSNMILNQIFKYIMILFWGFFVWYLVPPIFRYGSSYIEKKTANNRTIEQTNEDQLQINTNIQNNQTSNQTSKKKEVIDVGKSKSKSKSESKDEKNKLINVNQLKSTNKTRKSSENNDGQISNQTIESKNNIDIPPVKIENKSNNKTPKRPRSQPKSQNSKTKKSRTNKN